MTRPLHIGLLGAMPAEIGADLSHLHDFVQTDHGDLTLHRGRWSEQVQLTLAWSGWGKVSAARAATRLLASAPDLDLLLFSGVAGAADGALQQWDVVLADAVVQHDMNASPLFPRFTLPPLNRDRLHPDAGWLTWAGNGLGEAHASGELDRFGHLHQGLVATGDQFIGDAQVLSALATSLPGVMAVEMEGAAVAQVAEQEGVPWLVMRVISDGADAAAASSFSTFIKVYEQSAWALVEALLKRLDSAPVTP